MEVSSGVSPLLTSLSLAGISPTLSIQKALGGDGKGSMSEPTGQASGGGNRKYALEVKLNRGRDNCLPLLPPARAAALTASAQCLVREIPKCPKQGIKPCTAGKGLWT